MTQPSVSVMGTMKLPSSAPVRLAPVMLAPVLLTLVMLGSSVGSDATLVVPPSSGPVVSSADEADDADESLTETLELLVLDIEAAVADAEAALSDPVVVSESSAFVSDVASGLVAEVTSEGMLVTPPVVPSSVVLEVVADPPDIEIDSSEGSVSPSPKSEGRHTASSWQCSPLSHALPNAHSQNRVPGSQFCGMQYPEWQTSGSVQVSPGPQ